MSCCLLESPAGLPLGSLTSPLAPYLHPQIHTSRGWLVSSVLCPGAQPRALEYTVIPPCPQVDFTVRHISLTISLAPATSASSQTAPGAWTWSSGSYSARRGAPLLIPMRNKTPGGCCDLSSHPPCPGRGSQPSSEEGASVIPWAAHG